MATLPRSRDAGFRPTAQVRVRSLMRLNEAVQKINSILDLDELLDRVVNDIAAAFGCLEAAILLREDGTDLMCVAAVTGCTKACKHDRFRIGVDGITGWVASTGLPFYAPDVTQEPRYIACEETTRSELDLPLIAHGEVIGVFSAQHPDVDGFPAEQRELLEALTHHIAVAIWNARMFQRERAEKHRLEQQEDEARRIQQGLFPKTPPEIPGFFVDGQCVPAGAVGGDWYDFLPHARPACSRTSADSEGVWAIDPSWIKAAWVARAGAAGRQPLWAFVLADVAGKGMSAALLMSATRGVLRSVAEHLLSPAAVLQHLNRVLRDDLPPEKFVTMIYAVLDPAKRLLTYANAGHPWPIFANGGGAHFLKTETGLPLGVGDGDYDEHTVEVPEHSSLLLYSDGVSEAVNAAGEEYGSKRLLQHALRPDVSATTVLRDVCDFTEPRPLLDDATVIVVRS